MKISQNLLGMTLLTILRSTVFVCSRTAFRRHERARFLAFLSFSPEVCTMRPAASTVNTLWPSLALSSSAYMKSLMKSGPSGLSIFE